MDSAAYLGYLCFEVEFRVVGVPGIDENSMTCASYFN